MAYFPTSPKQQLCTTWQNGKTQKSHFIIQMLYPMSQDFNQQLSDVFNLVDLQTVGFIAMLLNGGS